MVIFFWKFKNIIVIIKKTWYNKMIRKKSIIINGGNSLVNR